MVHKDIEMQESLKIDCKNCFGFCCTALYFSKSDGFPNDKQAGKPCINLDAISLIKLDLVVYRSKVNALLLETSEFIRNKYKKDKSSNINHKKLIAGRLNLIGADLKNKRLVGENLSGALLIAANLKGTNLSGVDFLGADLRDTDLRGANLSKSIYLTQLQLNSAKGDINTQLPISLSRPEHWCY